MEREEIKAQVDKKIIIEENIIIFRICILSRSAAIRPISTTMFLNILKLPPSLSLTEQSLHFRL